MDLTHRLAPRALGAAVPEPPQADGKYTFQVSSGGMSIRVHYAGDTWTLLDQEGGWRRRRYDEAFKAEAWLCLRRGKRHAELKSLSDRSQLRVHELIML